MCQRKQGKEQTCTLHIVFICDGIHSTLRFNKERKKKQRKQTNKKERKTSFHTVWCVSAAKASLLLEITPVSQVNTLHYGAQLLRTLLSFITVIEIIRNHWLNTQRSDTMETYCHQSRFTTIPVYAVCIGPRRTGNPHNSGCILNNHNFLLYLALNLQCQFRTTCRNSGRMYICIESTNVSHRPYLSYTTFSATSRHGTRKCFLYQECPTRGSPGRVLRPRAVYVYSDTSANEWPC